jgi:hypothetical protein
MHIVEGWISHLRTINSGLEVSDVKSLLEEFHKEAILGRVSKTKVALMATSI